LQKQFGSSIRLDGDDYPPTTLNHFLARMFSMMFFGGLAMGFGLSRFLPQEVQAWIDDNKMMFYGSVMVCNVLSSSLLQTGAFEVYVGGKLVGSRLETGELVDMHVIVDAVRRTLKQQ
jgi:selT/selW/selH-like putative selenoprotein